VDWLRAGIDVRTVQEWLGRDGIGAGVRDACWPRNARDAIDAGSEVVAYRVQLSSWLSPPSIR
jgi:hypothetical protein